MNTTPIMRFDGVELSLNTSSCTEENISTDHFLFNIGAVYFIKIVIVSIISVLIVVSNVLNIYILSRDCHIPKISKLFLLNLSISDLCVGMISCVPTIYSAITRFWPYGSVWCQIAGIVHGSSCAISIWSISMVSIDRYFAICKPLKYPTFRSSRKAFFVILCLWTLALITFISPPLSKAGFIYYQFNSDENICGLHWEYKWFCILTAVYIPLLSGSILVFTNVRMIRTIMSRKQDLDKINSRNTSSRQGMSAVKLLISTSSIYFVAWGPYVTEVLLTSFVDGFYVPGLMKFSFMWLANSNSFMNVITFSVVYRSFRHELKRLFLKNICHCVQLSQLCSGGQRRNNCESSELGNDSLFMQAGNDSRNAYAKETVVDSSIFMSELSASKTFR